MAKMKTPKLWQKALAMYLLAIGVGIYCNAMMWTHIDSLHSPYAFWMKAGLIGIFDLSVFWLTTWKLFGPSPELRVFCFWAIGFLLIIGLVHAGAVGQYEDSRAENLEMIRTVGDAQAKIASATTKAAIEASGKQAQQMNQSGQRNTARATIKSGGEAASTAAGTAQKGLNDLAERAKPSTFLPDWYMKGAQYWVLMSLAGCALMWAFKIWGDTGLDIDGDGETDEVFAYKSDREIKELKQQREWERQRQETRNGQQPHFQQPRPPAQR